MIQTPPITPTSNDKFCKHIKADGSPCGAYRLKDSNFCYQHEPSKAAERTASRSRGGKKSQAEGIPNWTDRELTTVQEVETLVQDLLNATIRGDIHPRLINAANGLLTLLLKAKELGSLEDRLAKLEAEIIMKGRAS